MKNTTSNTFTFHDLECIARESDKYIPTSRGFLICCLAHDGRRPNLSLALGKQGELLVYCFGGCSFQNITTALNDKDMLSGGYRHSVQELKIPKYPKSELHYRHSLWEGSQDIKGNLAEVYLCNRLGDDHFQIPKTLRFLSTLKHRPSGEFFPCMIGAVTRWPQREIMALHRTYITHDGTKKADVSSNKMMLGTTKGGAVRITPPGPTLVIAEGIETAMSVHVATGLPTWAALSTSGMVHVQVPPLSITQEIIIAADGDKAGITAAYKLAQRLLMEGYKVRIARPPAGLDFNDMLRGGKL